MSVDVVDLGGKKVGTVQLPPRWFEADVKPAVVHQVVVAQRAAARQGTHKTKTRAQKSGGGAKPYRQKGTGRARQGSIRSPQYAGGGVAHGRTPSNWAKRVNKKMRRAALSSVLTQRATESAVIVVRAFQFESPSTKAAVAAFDAIGCPQSEAKPAKVLVVLADLNQATIRSIRNLPRVHTITVDQLNVYDVLNAPHLVIDEAALDLIGTGERAGQRDGQRAGQRDGQGAGEEVGESPEDGTEEAA